MNLCVERLPSVSRIGFLLVLLMALAALAGCGKKTKETGDAVADEVTGYRAVQQGDRLKKQIGKIDEERREREERASDE